MIGRALRCLALAALTGCGTCNPSDPYELLGAHAGPGAIDCGTAGRDGDAITPEAARACAVDALARDAPFRVAVAQLVFDGQDVVGFAGDGTPAGLVRLHYCSSHGPFTGDHEDIRWLACADLLDRGDACASLDDDLCLACDAPRPLD